MTVDKSDQPARIRSTRSPGLVEIARTIRARGALALFVDQYRRQGDLPHLRMGLHRLVLVLHPDHVRRVLLTGRDHFDKLGSWEGSRNLLIGDGLIAATGPAWRRQRKLMATFFTPRSVEQYHSLFVTAAEMVAQRWESPAVAGRTVDVFDEMTRVTAWIILRSMFSTDIDERRLRSLEGDVEAWIQFANRREGLPVKAPLWVPLPSHRRYRAGRDRVVTLLREIITARHALPEAERPDDLLNKLMTARDEETGAGMSDQLLLDECLGIFVAGHETTARTLAFLWLALNDNPDVAGRLRAELDAVLPGGRAPSLEELTRLTYLDRTLKEVLRLYPPAPAVPRDPVEDQVMDGVPLEVGTFLLVSPYLSHRHPDFWEEPERFDPDRFLPENEAGRHDFAYYPFGGGPRVCLGNSFALLELKVLAAILVARFEARLPAGHEPRIDIGGTLTARNGLPVRVTRRP